MHGTAHTAVPLPKIVHPKQPLFADVANVNQPKCNGWPLLGGASFVIKASPVPGKSGSIAQLWSMRISQISFADIPPCNLSSDLSAATTSWAFGTLKHLSHSFNSVMSALIITFKSYALIFSVENLKLGPNSCAHGIMLVNQL
ncbi:uncharacterized protein NPIL_365171 [Nephila pilipes]|uniref:Uncharacterized protein n=1 Tax=Nephila pilipes TaxID=299642 RepID=A0A8X6QQV0_NEPPI|nr:uncharacterized protein NPIL_365171 [Nephila pilipes]